MEEFALFIAQFWRDIWSLFDQTIFTIRGLPVSLGDILFSLLLVSFAMSVFWKGAKA